MLKTLKDHFIQQRWWWIGGFIAILPFLLYWYRLIISNLSPFDAIADSAGVVFSIERLDRLQSLNDTISYKNIFDKWVLVEKSKADFKYLERLLDNDAKGLLQQPLTLSIETSSAQTLDFLYIFDASWHRIDIPSLLTKKGIPFKSYTLAGGHTVYNAFFNNDVAFTFATSKNLLLAARYAFMVEDALSTLDAGTGISASHKFSKIEKSLSEQHYDCSIYLNIKALPTMLSSFLMPTKKENLEKIGENIAWIGSGITFSKEGIGLQGTLTTVNNNSYHYALPTSSYHDRQRMTEVLPSNTAALFWVGVNDFKQYYNRAGFDFDFGNLIASWVGEDVACAITEPLSEEASSEVYAVFNIKDSLLAKKKMQILESKKGVKFESFYNMHIIKQIDNDNILNCITGNQVILKDPYYAFIGNYAVFCSSRSGLEVCIDKYLANQTLANDALYQEFAQNITSKSGLYFYLNIDKIDELLKSSLSEEVRPQLETQLTQLRKLNFLGVQLQPEPASFSFSGKWKWTNAKRMKTSASIAWKTLLDSEAVIPPTVTKAEDKESEEVFIQDQNSQIYIISGGGEVRVKKAIESKILSPIKQIDYFNNGNLYYIFNTERKVHLLDYQGKEAQNFPLSLQSPASTGMLVADFDGNGAYHYFIPAQNGNIYGYESNGKPLSGWNPRSGIGIVKQPMGHFQVGNKDYIIALTDKNLYTMQRNGEFRISPIPVESNIISPPAFQNTPTSQRIVVANTKGMAHNINLAGQIFNIALPTGNSTNVRTLYADICGDTRKEYITLNDNVLCGYGYEGEVFKKIFERQFQDKLDDFFTLTLPDSPKDHIGFVCRAASHVFLMDGAGKVYKNFPLAGTTAFEVTDFFGEGVPVLIVANGASVYTYKLR
jgi:hypothetical protein